MTTIPPPAWTIAGRVASHAQARVDLAAPAAGLSLAPGDRVLGLDLRTPAGDAGLVDHWVRGGDLVAVYEPPDPRRLRATALWRAPEPGRPAWELVVSAQTSLVESDSALAVTCDLAADEILAAGSAGGRLVWTSLPADSISCPPMATGLVFRRTADAVLVAVHPDDARRIMLRRGDGRAGVECWLFSTALEKGVLLRGRVLAAAGPAGDRDWAETLLAAFAASPPPLTT